MASPFVRTDADGHIVGDIDGKISGDLARYLNDMMKGSSSPIATHTAGTTGKSDSTITGTLGAEQADGYAFTLTAGVTYSFAMRGLEDPYLLLRNPATGKFVGEDDDGGFGRSALITYTPTTTGTYHLFASSWYHLDPSAPGYPTADQGTYTIDVWRANAANDVPDTLTGALEIGPDSTTFGHIETAGDADMYRIDLTEGLVYNFVLAGGVAGSDFTAAPGDLIAYVDILDADGNLLEWNVNYETGVGFFAQETGTYYVRISPYEAEGLPDLTGGYTLDVSEGIDPTTRDPLQSLNWDSANNVPFVDTNSDSRGDTAYVYFAAAGQNFGELADDGVTPMTTYGWQQHQIDAVMSALEQYESILNVNYEITTDVSKATFRLLTTNSEDYGAYFYPRDPDEYGDAQGIGVFNLLSGGFGSRPESLVQGGFSYAVILHEFGHAHGIAHPHDNGGGSEVMLGVNGATGSYGVYNLNQGVYTVMSYNDAWPLHPDGPTENPVTGGIGAVIDHGWSGTLGAFDIAVLQARYGVHANNTGDDTYTLNDDYKTAYYQTIWDTGGNDTIAYGGALDAQIDLTAATLDYTPTGGGVLSFLYNDPQPNFTTEIKGGYTIANKVVIENATGGSGDDVLIGNAVANRLTGNAGDDYLLGGKGGDTLNGGAGFDTASYRTSESGVKVNLQGSADGGDAKGDRLISIEALEGSNHKDELGGSNADDTIDGLGGDDKIDGGNGRDTLSGGDGIDFIEGGNDQDLLDGGAGNDNLLGGNGVDTLNGGAGNDRLSGGNGKDLFVFDDAGTDTITDYQKGEKIDLSGLTGVDSSDVTITRGKIFVDLDGADDLTILFQGGSTATMNDLIFAAPAGSGGAQAGGLQNEQMMIV